MPDVEPPVERTWLDRLREWTGQDLRAAAARGPERSSSPPAVAGSKGPGTEGSNSLRRAREGIAAYETCECQRIGPFAYLGTKAVGY